MSGLWALDIIDDDDVELYDASETRNPGRDGGVDDGGDADSQASVVKGRYVTVGVAGAGRSRARPSAGRKR